MAPTAAVFLTGTRAPAVGAELAKTESVLAAGKRIGGELKSAARIMSLTGHVGTAPAGQGILLAFCLRSGVCLRSGASHVQVMCPTCLCGVDSRWP